jgi:ferritin-like metal-binding protein YciE
MTNPSNGALRETFVVGLKNAHAVEKEALAIMEPQIARLENYPELKERLRLHVEETNGQLVRLEEILGSLSEDYSSLKDMMAKMGGTFAAMGHTVAGDEILKNTFANFAFENFEIAAYRSLIVLADAGGFSSAATNLRKTLQEEEAMAAWLAENIAPTTLQYVNLKDSGKTAKR